MACLAGRHSWSDRCDNLWVSYQLSHACAYFRWECSSLAGDRWHVSNPSTSAGMSGDQRFDGRPLAATTAVQLVMLTCNGALCNTASQMRPLAEFLIFSSRSTGGYAITWENRASEAARYCRASGMSGRGSGWGTAALCSCA